MNTPHNSQTFSYTAQRSAYISTIAALMFLMLAEGGLITFVITLFIHNAWLKLLPVAIILALLLYILFNLLAPLYTKHQLTASHLLLRYGFALDIHVPLATIVNAQPVHEQLTMLQPTKASYDAKKQRIVATFSNQGQVLLQLDKLHPYNLDRKSVLVQEILLNVDERDALLVALDGVDVIGGGQREHYGHSGRPQGPPLHTAPLPPLRALSRLPRGLAIRTQSLTRRFDRFTAVNNLNLSIPQGEIYGFLGSNGAGKTTTIKMLVGLLEPNVGQVWIAGHNVWTEPLAAKAALGYVADRALLYERLTGREFLNFLAQMRSIPLKQSTERIESLLDLLELSEYADRPCGAYSFGMKRKLSLAGALLHQPPVLILDEPLNGLDPRSARRLKDLFIELAAGGTTILLSTHDLATAEAVCHRVGIIHQGRLLAEGSPTELAQLSTASDLETVFLNLTQEVAI